jgi:Na+/melibiose symporter-like transporter
MQTPGQSQLSRQGRLADFFGLKRNLVILLIAIFVIRAGEELWMRFVPKYLQAVGATVFVIGLYDALRTLLGAVYAYPGGLLVDIWGHRGAFIIFNIISIVGYALVLLVPRWFAVIAGNVSLPFMDLLFHAGDVLPSRSRAGSKSALDGCRYSVGNQAIANHDRAHLRRDPY